LIIVAQKLFHITSGYRRCCLAV